MCLAHLLSGADPRGGGPWPPPNSNASYSKPVLRNFSREKGNYAPPQSLALDLSLSAMGIF